jgi:hypothetical protein
MTADRRRRVHASTMPPELDEIEVVEHLVDVPAGPDFHKHAVFDGYEMLARKALATRVAKASALIFGLLLSAGAARASDVMHVPLACKYHQESHAIAGGLVGVIVGETGGKGMRFLPRLCVSVGAALVAGTVKEYVIDHHARPSEIPPWALGAGVVAVAYEFRW